MGKQHARQRDVAARQAGGDDVASGCGHLVGLAHRQNARGVWTGFELGCYGIGANRLDDEMGQRLQAGLRWCARRTRKRSFGVRVSSRTRHQVVPFDVWIERMRGAELERKLPANPNRLDGDDRRGASDLRANDGAESEWTTTDDGD